MPDRWPPGVTACTFKPAAPGQNTEAPRPAAGASRQRLITPRSGVMLIRLLQGAPSASAAGVRAALPLEVSPKGAQALPWPARGGSACGWLGWAAGGPGASGARSAAGAKASGIEAPPGGRDHVFLWARCAARKPGRHRRDAREGIENDPLLSSITEPQPRQQDSHFPTPRESAVI
jgi:hypothetical protein